MNRKIKSISGLITNSSTECFILRGSPAQIKSFYKRFSKYFIYLPNISVIKDFISGKLGIDHHYSKYVLWSIAREELSLLDDILKVTDHTFDEAWNFLLPSLTEKLDGGLLIYYDYRNNNKIISGLKNLFPEFEESDKYIWTIAD